MEPDHKGMYIPKISKIDRLVLEKLSGEEEGEEEEGGEGEGKNSRNFRKV